MRLFLIVCLLSFACGKREAVLTGWGIGTDAGRVNRGPDDNAGESGGPTKGPPDAAAGSPAMDPRPDQPSPPGQPGPPREVVADAAAPGEAGSAPGFTPANPDGARDGSADGDGDARQCPETDRCD